MPTLERPSQVRGRQAMPTGAWGRTGCGTRTSSRLIRRAGTRGRAWPTMGTAARAGGRTPGGAAGRVGRTVSAPPSGQPVIPGVVPANADPNPTSPPRRKMHRLETMAQHTGLGRFVPMRLPPFCPQSVANRTGLIFVVVLERGSEGGFPRSLGHRGRRRSKAQVPSPVR